jgi:hypothetical protein
MGISSRRIHYPSWSRWYVRLQFAVATDAPLHVSDDRLATLIHMLMFEPGQFESRSFLCRRKA